MPRREKPNPVVVPLKIAPATGAGAGICRSSKGGVSGGGMGGQRAGGMKGGGKRKTHVGNK